MIHLHAAFIVNIKYKSSNLVIYCMSFQICVQDVQMCPRAASSLTCIPRISPCLLMFPLSEPAVHLHLLMCCPDRHHMEHNIWQLFGNSNKNECWDLNSSVLSTRLSPCQQALFDGCSGRGQKRCLSSFLF